MRISHTNHELRNWLATLHLNDSELMELEKLKLGISEKSPTLVYTTMNLIRLKWWFVISSLVLFCMPWCIRQQLFLSPDASVKQAFEFFSSWAQSQCQVSRNYANKGHHHFTHHHHYLPMSGICHSGEWSRGEGEAQVRPHCSTSDGLTFASNFLPLLFVGLLGLFIGMQRFL